MDTPKSKSTNNNNKLINPTSSDSPAFQDSPIFNYISNLSPIPPVKNEPVVQGFPGLASPPLVFRSPRINSLSSLLARKLLSSGSNSDFPQDNDKHQKNDEDPGNLAKLDPEFQTLLISKDQKACDTEKLGEVVHCSPSGCIDEYLTDPVDCPKSSSKIQSDKVPQSSEGGCLKKKDNGSCQDVHLGGSRPLKVKGSAEAKSRISIKVVKNDARGLISSSSECLGPRILTEHTSDTELCQNGDSINEASHLERGTLRRCLFDEDQKKYSDGSRYWNSNDNLTRRQELAYMSYTGTSGDKEIIDVVKSATSMGVSPVTGNYTVAISKPLGIGLHLNSVVYPKSMDSANDSQQSSVVRVEGKNSVFSMNDQSEGKVNALNLVKKVPASFEERHQNKACSVATSGEAICSDVVEHMHSPIVLKPNARITTNGKRKVSPELAGSNEESNQVSFKKIRKKASGSGDDDNLKRCNCKKTKCLKLYCDCFAAGFYCGESCACQGCFNRPEYEDTVLETRQQIESRNPLAFAPKVVQPVTDSPASIKEVGDLSTPSSARHKRGCNCKKSMCLKKYCECYQGNAGCSDNCRCEGCQNTYGIREDYSISRELMMRKVAGEMSEGLLNGRQEISIVGSNFVNSRVHNTPNMTPVTPALQSSDLRKNAPKSRLPFRKVLQTADSHHDMLKSNENFSTSKNSESHSMLLDKSKESIEIGALDAEKCFENLEDRLESACDESTSASCSAQMSNSDVVSIVRPSSSKTSNLVNITQPQLFVESGLPPISSSLRWRSSPITPITQSAGSKNQDFGSGSKHSDMLEDDTPDILKNSSTPIQSVKVSSPNKKRVSPPHNNTGSSGPLKICRRFVLRAMPAFPPLTPHSKNKGNDINTQPSDT